MTGLNPIYTEKRECQDCYKCVRQCPVKAIKVQDACATVVAEMCVLCGSCVSSCPNSAKRVRDDLPRARQLMGVRPRVYVSLAPSWVTEFPDMPAAAMISALKRLGFAGVSETALGAQLVSAHVAKTLNENPGKILISSACPSVVSYIQKHRPKLAGNFTTLLSPLLAHCRFLRETYGRQIGIVFIGPCIAKKTEADQHPELLDVALTFEDLRRWLAAERLAVGAATPEDVFVPQAAHEGALYPVDGGMIAGIQAHCPVDNASFMSFSGLSAVNSALEGLDDFPTEKGLFLELLACEGGCVNGPKVSQPGKTALKRAIVLTGSKYSKEHPVPRAPEGDISMPIDPTPFDQPPISDAQIREALRAVGKRSVDDELNCGGCGYDSCRLFGKALLAGRAEKSMCVTWMRKLASKKANALIHKMPSAVVIVDDALKILECNAAFSELMNRNMKDPSASFEGSPLMSLIPFHNLFSAVLKTGQDILDKDIRFRETILHISIFTIDPHAVVGAIIQDTTAPSVQKEQVIKRAREIIQKNLATVQKIAYLLGENAAESEVTLNGIIESFSPEKLEDDNTGGNKNAWRDLYRR